MALLTVISIDDVCGRHLTPPPGQIHRVLGRRATAGVGGGCGISRLPHDSVGGDQVLASLSAPAEMSRIEVRSVK
jgi:hypothetical protein